MDTLLDFIITTALPLILSLQHSNVVFSQVIVSKVPEIAYIFRECKHKIVMKACLLDLCTVLMSQKKILRFSRSVLFDDYIN